MTDRAPRRMPFLVFSTIVCVGLTAILGTVGYRASPSPSSSPTPRTRPDCVLRRDASRRDDGGNRGRIGGMGVGIGYLGSYIAISLGMVLRHRTCRACSPAIAGTFLLFSLPCFFFVRERGNATPRTVFGWRGDGHLDAHTTITTLREGTSIPASFASSSVASSTPTPSTPSSASCSCTR